MCIRDRYNRVCEKHADLWDKVDEAYFNLPDDYDSVSYTHLDVYKRQARHSACGRCFPPGRPGCGREHSSPLL